MWLRRTSRKVGFENKGAEWMKIYIWDRVEGDRRVVDVYFSKPTKFSYIEWI